MNPPSPPANDETDISAWWVVYPFVAGRPYNGTLHDIQALGALLGRIHWTTSLPQLRAADNTQPLPRAEVTSDFKANNLIRLTKRERELWPLALNHMLWEEGTWALEDNDDAWTDPHQGAHLLDLALASPDRYPLP